MPMKNQPHPACPPVMIAVLDEGVTPHMFCLVSPQAPAGAVGVPPAPTFRFSGRHLEPLTPPDPLDPLVVDLTTQPASVRSNSAISR